MVELCWYCERGVAFHGRMRTHTGEGSQAECLMWWIIEISIKSAQYQRARMSIGTKHLKYQAGRFVQIIFLHGTVAVFRFLYEAWIFWTCTHSHTYIADVDQVWLSMCSIEITLPWITWSTCKLGIVWNGSQLYMAEQQKHRLVTKWMESRILGQEKAPLILLILVSNINTWSRSHVMMALGFPFLSCTIPTMISYLLHLYWLV